MSSTPLSGNYRHAFVSGASSGLGEAFVRMLLAEGVEVWGTAREVSRLAGFAGEPRFHPVALELGRETQAREAFCQAASEAGGSFDLVVLNAGFGVFAPFESLDFSVWRGQLEAMVCGTAALSHEALRGMRACDRGTLVHVSSLAVEFPLPCMSAYNMSKAALSALSETLLAEVRGTPLKVIDFRPGDYNSSFNQRMQPEAVVQAQPRLRRMWERNDANVRSAPLPAKAAQDLRSVLSSGRSGVVRSGSFFQARLAPFLSRLAPSAWRRSVMARYFDSA